MASYLDSKYLSLLSGQLRNFKRKSDNLYNFSCPLCGDSKSHSLKARGYVYRVGDKMLYTCHNQCGTMSVQSLLQKVNPGLYREYVKELMMEKYGPKHDRVEDFGDQVRKRFEEQVRPLGDRFDGLVNVSQLANWHPCKLYVEKRQIPEEWYDDLYYTPNFMEWTNTLIPNKFSEDALKYDEPRLVIPFVAKDNVTFGYQGRSLKPDSEVKYITIMLESYPKVFGLDRVDLDRTTYVFEGPIDAMFIPNSVAAAGCELHHIVHHLNKNTAVLCFDNEKRSKAIVKKMVAAANFGYKVCVWPPDLQQKDVNEMILAGMDSGFIKRMIDLNTSEGLAATLAINYWRRCEWTNGTSDLPV